MKKTARIIVWFRKDLRIHDNEALSKAIENGEEIIPVYILDEDELMGKTLFGFRKTGYFRTQFLLESVQELRQSFQDLGIDLIVRLGNPADEIFELVKTLQVDTLYANMERTHDEVLVQNAVEKKLWSLGVESHFFRGKILYYTQDLPFPISQSPDSFTSFKKEVEKFIPIRPPLPAPERISSWSSTIETGEIPSVEDLGLKVLPKYKRSQLSYIGGEKVGLERLHYYFDNELIEDYHQHHWDISGINNTSKLSPWIALGCLSPKYIYAQLQQYVQQHKKNKSTQDFFFELLWRDYYRLMGKKYGDKIFAKGGIIGQETKSLTEDQARLEQWINGQTASSFINACMLQLKKTGTLSAKGRLLTSSYLVNELQLNWQMGAAYFQHILIDYDICSNWVNWNFAGGVGPDPKDNRQLNVENQRKRLDPNQSYTRLWLKDSLQAS